MEDTKLAFIFTLYTVGLMSRVFANDPEKPSRVIPKTQKMVLDATLLNTQHYKVWRKPGKGVAPFPTPHCCSYWKRSLQVTLDKIICHCLPPDRTWHKVNKQKADYRGDLGEGRARVEARTLLVYAAHWPIKWNMGLMSQAVSQTKICAWARMPGYSLN